MHDEIRAILDDRKLRGEARVEALAALFDPFVYEVYPMKTHVEVEQVTVYGLELGVDANGYASRVLFPDGAEIDE